jgi:hypothetical protein
MKTLVGFSLLFGFIGILFGYGAHPSLQACCSGLATGLVIGLIVGGIVLDETNKKK